MTEYTSKRDAIVIGAGETAFIAPGAIIGAPSSQSGPRYAVQMGENSELFIEGAISHEASFGQAAIATNGSSQIEIGETGSLYSSYQGIEAKGPLLLTNNGSIETGGFAVSLKDAGSSTVINNGSITAGGEYGIFFQSSGEFEDIQRITNTGEIKARTALYGSGNGNYDIDNTGLIEGTYGIDVSVFGNLIHGDPPTLMLGTIDIANSGTIIGTGSALNIGGFAHITVNNSGLIIGRVYLDSGLLKNTGTIRGNVLIDGGTYDGRGGSVEGTIDLGAGTGKAYGGSGSDTIIGGWGEDYIDGGEGADRLIGGTWDDTFVVDNLLDEVVEHAGEGKDIVLAHTSYALNEAASIEILKVFDVTATTSINLTGNTGANSIIGNAGANILDGQAGADALDGGAGDDTLVGGDGDDIIKGGAGVDTVIFSGKRGDYTFTLGSGDSLIVKEATPTSSLPQSVSPLQMGHSPSAKSVRWRNHLSHLRLRRIRTYLSYIPHLW